ncbi:MAG: hypothetical protein ACJ709_02675, partial [Nitrososphaeraceae archaeon]
IQGSKKYTIKKIVKNIKRPTLVLEAEKDDSFPGQPKKVYDALTSPKVTLSLQKKRVLRNTARVVLQLYPTREYSIG